MTLQDLKIDEGDIKKGINTHYRIEVVSDVYNIIIFWNNFEEIRKDLAIEYTFTDMNILFECLSNFKVDTYDVYIFSDKRKNEYGVGIQFKSNSDLDDLNQIKKIIDNIYYRIANNLRNQINLFITVYRYLSILLKNCDEIKRLIIIIQKG